MRYYILQSCFTGHKNVLRTAPYTERGFKTYGAARYFKNKHSIQSSQIVREDRIVVVQDSYSRRNN